MKYGFDFHGVLDHEQDTYRDMAKKFLEEGHDVYLITGTMDCDLLNKQLETAGIIKGVHYNKFFSVSDYLIEQGFECTFIREGNPYFGDIEEWDAAKGYFCATEGIDMHWDDTKDYEEYFSTPFTLVIS